MIKQNKKSRFLFILTALVLTVTQLYTPDILGIKVYAQPGVVQSEETSSKESDDGESSNLLDSEIQPEVEEDVSQIAEETQSGGAETPDPSASKPQAKDAGSNASGKASTKNADAQTEVPIEEDNDLTVAAAGAAEETGPIDISTGYRHYFKSNYYSAYDNTGLSAPQLQLTAAGADYWESSDIKIVTVAADIDTSKAVAAAGAAGTATITAKAGGADGVTVGTAVLSVPHVSEDFENNPSGNWNTYFNGLPLASTSNLYGASSQTQIKVVSIPDASGNDTNAFEFSCGRSGGANRGIQKMFDSVKQDIVELDFDWNIGDLAGRTTWLSIKDSEFKAANSSEKGFRYLMLKMDFDSSGGRKLFYGSGGRDFTNETINLPTDLKPLFGGTLVQPFSWYNVKVTLDFIAQTTTFSLADKATNETTGVIQIPFPDDLVAAGNLDFGAISLNSNSAGNDPTTEIYENFAVRMYVDNFNVYSDAYDYSDREFYSLNVNNGTGGGQYMEGQLVTVRADNPEVDMEFSNWTAEPTITLTQDGSDPCKWTFYMPAENVTLTPSYKPFAITEGYQYFFKSDFYSVYNKPNSAPQASFTAEGADYWESSDDAIVSVTANSDPAFAVVTARNSGFATITAKAGGANGDVVGTVSVYVPFISEDFENSPEPKWSITAGGNSGSASSNTGLSTGTTDFKVVSVSDASGVQTNAFEFSSGRGDTTFRSVQKRFTPVKQDVVELDFDWNIGGMSRSSTWLSIKDSEFTADNSSEKGFRYLVLKTEYVDPNNRVLSFGSGNRDASNAAGGNDFIHPENAQQLFGGAKVSPNTWYNVNVTLNFVTQTTTFSLTNKATGVTTGQIEIAFPSDLVAAGNLDFGAISFISAGAGNNATVYEQYPVRMYVDNFNAYGKNYPSYDMNVTNGTGGGSYRAGTTVTVRADEVGEGLAVRNWTTIPEDIKMVQDSSDPFTWSFKMPASDVTLTANYGLEYEIEVSTETYGGAGRMRDVTLFGKPTDKYLAVRLTESSEEGAAATVKTSMVILEAKEDMTISYQNERTQLEFWLTDGVPDFTGSDIGVTVYASGAAPDAPAS